MISASFINTKGGSGKSTLCDLMSHVLRLSKNQVACFNLDDQHHVSESAENLDNADYALFDTMGAFHTETLELLEDIKKDDQAIIICPVGTGYTDQKEYDFVISEFKKHNVLDKTIFVLNRVNARTKAVKECRDILKSKGVKVSRASISYLEDYAQRRYTGRCVSEISMLIHEINIILEK